MQVFDYTDYKLFVVERIRSMPRRGRGELTRIAEALRVHPTLLSQVFGGPRDLSLEQAALLGEHFKLNEIEREYFVDLVGLCRAGNESLRNVLKKRLSFLKTQAQQASVNSSSQVIYPSSDQAEQT